MLNSIFYYLLIFCERRSCVGHDLNWRSSNEKVSATNALGESNNENSFNARFKKRMHLNIVNSTTIKRHG